MAMHRVLMVVHLLVCLSIVTGSTHTRDDTTYISSNANQMCPIRLKVPAVSNGALYAVLEQQQTALLMLLGFGGFSLVLAMCYNAIRKHIFHEKRNIDSTFDAGGNVSISLTAVTIACQFFWPLDLLHSATVTIKRGVAGVYWYAAGVVFTAFIFPIISVQFKTKSPGAKTYLQVIKARFGTCTHVLFCVFALAINLYVIACMILAGQAAIKSLTKDSSDEFCVLILAVLFGSYSYLGGLGTTFYVSYFNATLTFISMFVILSTVYYSKDRGKEYLSGMSTLYDYVSCLEGPESNEGRSFLTFRSPITLLYGVVTAIGTCGSVICDQAAWQSRVAAKPMQGVIGFLLGGCIWFSIPITMAMATGMSYLTMSAANGSYPLTMDEVDQGLVTPLIMENALGTAGAIIVLTLSAMALMSTGSGEVMAVASVIIYDIYQTYVMPFRQNTPPECCILCGRTKSIFYDPQILDQDENTFCHCERVSKCVACHADILALASGGRYLKRHYTCAVHGDFRCYHDDLIAVKDACMLWIIVAIVPFGLVVLSSGIKLYWFYYIGALIGTPCFPPTALAIMWSKTTGRGMVIGCLMGFISGIVVDLAIASTLDGGLREFEANTMADIVIISATLTSFGVSLCLSIVVSLLGNNIKTPQDELHLWKVLISIDNPLQPWSLNYVDELQGVRQENCQVIDQMTLAFRTAKIVAYVGGLVGIIVIFAIIPGVMATLHVMDRSAFYGWVYFTHAFAFIIGVVVVFAPPAEELLGILKRMRMNKRVLTQSLAEYRKHKQETSVL